MFLIYVILIIAVIYFLDFKSDFSQEEAKKVGTVFGLGAIAILFLGILLSLLFNS